jgi:hypothetical protein
MQDLKAIKLKADIMWAFLDEPNQMSEKYQVDLCNLSEGAVTALEDVGIEVKRKEDKGFYIVAKSKKFPIRTETSDGNGVNCKVGNGSKGVAWIKPYAYTFKGKAGVSPGINKLVITDLIRYEADESALDDNLEEAL